MTIKKRSVVVSFEVETSLSLDRIAKNLKLSSLDFLFGGTPRQPQVRVVQHDTPPPSTKSTKSKK